MNVLNESAEEIFQQLMEEVGPKAKPNLKKIKEACDLIEKCRGVMNYSRVAAVATEHFGGPKEQTIQNNAQHKTYISARIREYQTRMRTRAQSTKFPEVTGRDRSPYPAEGLDAKTRLCIDSLLQDNHRLDTENKRLAQLLEQTTVHRPISLSEAFERGPTSTLGLDIALDSTGPEVPDSLVEALLILLSGEIVHFEVQRREQVMRLIYERDGIVHTLLSPAQWKESTDWLEWVQGAEKT
ncbi:hypothetical protein [Paraburkholderia largidicola]|uniref:Uncharacterized protein n=1 Tax=Paraburkholderia largidicola TaxID=3014751 RepID=A0A7I8BK20_9BURK|nr:hypothetical protein [Paraburkholderia sp. PGU16]BCF89064.1 hypothetical protein PPGU16_21310 [Paraburkholderia sp. PGU16]